MSIPTGDRLRLYSSPSMVMNVLACQAILRTSGSIGWEDLVKDVGQKRRPQVGVGYRCVDCGSRDLHGKAVEAPKRLVRGHLFGGDPAGPTGTRSDGPEGGSGLTQIEGAWRLLTKTPLGAGSR
jgi:hypothetical protein